MFGWKAERGAAASRDRADDMNSIYYTSIFIIHMYTYVYIQPPPPDI